MSHIIVPIGKHEPHNSAYIGKHEPHNSAYIGKHEPQNCFTNILKTRLLTQARDSQ